MQTTPPLTWLIRHTRERLSAADAQKVYEWYTEETTNMSFPVLAGRARVTLFYPARVRRYPAKPDTTAVVVITTNYKDWDLFTLVPLESVTLAASAIAEGPLPRAFPVLYEGYSEQDSYTLFQWATNRTRFKHGVMFNGLAFDHPRTQQDYEEQGYVLYYATNDGVMHRLKLKEAEDVEETTLLPLRKRREEQQEQQPSVTRAQSAGQVYERVTTVRLLEDEARAVDAWIEHGAPEELLKLGKGSYVHYPVRIVWLADRGTFGLEAAWSSNGQLDYRRRDRSVIRLGTGTVPVLNYDERDTAPSASVYWVNNVTKETQNFTQGEAAAIYAWKSGNVYRHQVLLRSRQQVAFVLDYVTSTVHVYAPNAREPAIGALHLDMVEQEQPVRKQRHRLVSVSLPLVVGSNV